MGKGEAGNGYRPTKLSLAPGQEKEQQQRAKRELQGAPQARLGQQKLRRTGEGSQSTRREHPEDAGKHQDDMEAKQAAFDENRRQNVCAYWEYTPALESMRQRRAKVLADLIQEELYVAGAAIEDAPCGCCGGAVKQIRIREVEVVDTEYRFVAKVPVLKCTAVECTSKPFSVPPVAAFCAPTSGTVDCRKWMTIPVVTLFSELNYSGVSGFGGSSYFPGYFSKFELLNRVFFLPIIIAAFAQGLDTLDKFMMPRGSVLQQATGSSHSAPVKSEQLITAAQEHCKVVHEAFQMPQLGKDCFGGCFVCARSLRENLNDGAFDIRIRARIYFSNFNPNFCLTILPSSSQERPSLTTSQ